jgi:Tol biopolymer transport system component
MNTRNLIHCLAGVVLAAAVVPTRAGTADGIRLGSGGPATCRSGGGGSFNPVFSADGRSILFVSQARNLVTNDSPSPHLNVYVRDLATGRTALVSPSASGIGGAEENANYPSISSNGQFVTYVVRTNIFDPMQPWNSFERTDAFVRDRALGTTRLVNVNTQGVASALRGSSGDAVISADGRWVVFASSATDLVADDTNGCQDVFVRDLLDGTTRVVSVGAMGGIPSSGGGGSGFTGASSAPSISADGRFVAFVSTATNLVSGVTNLAGEIYVRDLQAGVTCWASSNVAAQCALCPPGPYRSFNPVISADGRYVAFKATPDFGGIDPVLVLRYDLAAGTNTLLNTQPRGDYPENTIWMRRNWPAISPEGRFVAYEDQWDVFVWDAQLETNIHVSVRPQGAPPYTYFSHSPAMTPDGRFVAFVSSDPNLVTPATPPGRAQIFVRDLVAGTTRLVTGNRDDTPSRWDHELIQPVISPDGSLVAFDSEDDNLVEGDLNQASDVFVRDLNTNTTHLVSERHPDRTSLSGAALSGLANASCISSNSRWLVFTSHDGDLVPNDTNGLADIFIRDILTGATFTAGISNDLNDLNDQPVLSANGRYVAYVKSRNLGDTFTKGQVYRHDVQTGTSELVSRNVYAPYPYPAYGVSIRPAISPDGRFVAFESTATDLVPGGTLPTTNVFVRDMELGTNYLVSVSTNGTCGNGDSVNPSFSPDGRWVFFLSRAFNLVVTNWGLAYYGGYFARDLNANRTVLIGQLPGPASSPMRTEALALSADSRWAVFVNDRRAVWVRDLLAGSAMPIFVAAIPSDYIYSASISAGGRKVAFEQYAYTPGPYAGYRRQIFLVDREAGTTNLISVNRQGNGGGAGDSIQPLVTPDGQFVVFNSKAGDLVDGDWRAGGSVAPWEAARLPSPSDIFVRDLLQGITLVVSANHLGSAGTNASSKPFLAPDGRTVVFQSFADDLADGDYNATRDVFLLRLNAGDSDGDLLHDDWEMAYFDTLDRDGTLDFDGDSRTDRQEFVAGTDPTNAGSVLRVITLEHAATGSITIFWAAAPGRTYRVQYKNEAEDPTWLDSSGIVRINGRTASLVDSPAPFRSHRFYRVMLL